MLNALEHLWSICLAASVARQMYMRSPVGVGSLAKIYGGELVCKVLHSPSAFRKIKPLSQITCYKCILKCFSMHNILATFVVNYSHFGIHSQVEMIIWLQLIPCSLTVTLIQWNMFMNNDWKRFFLFLIVGRQRRGTRPSHFCRGNSAVGRKILQSLEGIKMAEKDATGGRKLTPQGRRDLDRIASQLSTKGKKAWAFPSQQTFKHKQNMCWMKYLAYCE